MSRKSEPLDYSNPGGKGSANYRHGHYKNGKPSPTYTSWRKMRERCNNKNDISYHNYGGRGISYDPRWEDFKNFLEDMGERPEETSLDRIDSNKDYCKNNCRWSSRKEQMRNTRNVRVLEISGKEKTMVEWSEESGVPLKTLWKRVDYGVTGEDLIYKGDLRSKRGKKQVEKDA